MIPPIRMRSPKQYLAGFLLLASLCGPAIYAAMPASLHYTWEVTPKTITVGDVIAINLIVTHDKDATVTPHVIAWTESFLLRDVTHAVVASGNVMKDTWSYQVSVFEPGKHKIPAKLRYTMPTEAPIFQPLSPVLVSVASVLPPTASVIGSLKPLLGLSFRVWPWVLGVGCILLVLYVLWRRRHSGSINPDQDTPLLSPEEEAMSDIEVLTASGQIDQHDYKAACLRMTAILRHFLSRQYHQKMQEMTSSEIEVALQGLALADGFCKDVMAFLYTCDQIKFANQRTTAKACYGLITTLKNLIQAAVDATPKEAPNL